MKIHRYILCAAATAALWSCNTNEIDVPYPEQPGQEEQGDPWQKLGMPDGESYINASGTPAANLRVIPREDLRFLAQKVDGFTDLLFRADTPQDILPKVGEIVTLAPDPDLAPVGYTCVIEEVKEENGQIRCTGRAATLDEAFDDYNLDMFLSPDGLAEACGGVAYDLVPDTQSRYTDEIDGDEDLGDGDRNPVIGVDLRGWKLGGQVKFVTDASISGNEAMGIRVTGTADFDSDEFFKNDKEYQQADLHLQAHAKVEAGMYFAMKYQDSKDNPAMEAGDARVDVWSQFALGANARLAAQWGQQHNAETGRKLNAPVFKMKPKYFRIPVVIAGVPYQIRFVVGSRTDVGVFGNVQWDFGFDYTYTMHTGFMLSGMSLEMMPVETVQGDGSPFKVENKFSFDAGMYLQFPTHVTFPVVHEKLSGIVLQATPRLELTASGEVDFTNKEENIYTVNPEIALDLATDVGAKWYVRLPGTKWKKCTTPISLSLPTLNLLTCPLLPEALPQTQRKDGATTGTVRWTLADPPLYGSFLGLCSKAPKMIVTDADGKLFATLDGGVYDKLNHATVFQATVTGMDPNKDYYAVPVVDIFNFTMRGTPVKMGDYALPSQLLTGIHNSILGQVLTLSYNPDGTLKRLYWKPDDEGAEEVLYTYPDKPQAEGYMLPTQIEMYTWGKNNYENETLTREEVTRFTSIKYDNTGRITSAHCHDQELPTDPEPESGTVTFFYDPSHGHLTEMRGGGGKMTLAWKATENANGRIYQLTGLTVRDEEGDGMSGNWQYGNDATANAHGQWTVAFFNDAFLPFQFAGIMGEAPNVLPNKITMMSEGEASTALFSYKLDNIGYVSRESITSFVEGYGDYTFNMDYTYSGGRSPMAAPAPQKTQKVKIPFRPGKGFSKGLFPHKSSRR